MFIDARQPEETRVVIAAAKDGHILEYDYESESRKIYKGNIYLAKVIRIEPSLQAAFVEYGQERHGFLPFSDIHPDYYRSTTKPEEDKDLETREAGETTKSEALIESSAIEVDGNSAVSEPADTEESNEGVSTFRRERVYRKYKIQEVLKKGQVLLVQVAREQRGEKGAALTTYLTLAGRYCVLMPNAGKSGGVSRKINDNGDRQRLKRIMDGIDVPEGMGVIVRTAGMDRTRAEIRSDFGYLVKIWQKIKDLTLASVAPQLIHTEGNIIQRSIRDFYSNDISEIWVEGEEALKITKNYMRILMPSHARKVKAYEESAIPMFHNYNLENQLDAIQDAKVPLKSGGYLVINTTEALVAIDVNSGRSTKERHIDDTALRTNLEAAEEVARQLRLRDLAGLVVIDFIDMDEAEHNQQVEARLTESAQNDRARVQIGQISSFGLMEMSRQRLRPSVFETAMSTCDVCSGIGHVRNPLSLALRALRILESNALNAQKGDLFVLTLPVESAYVLFNTKRREISALEDTHGVALDIRLDKELIGEEFKLTLNAREVKSFFRLSRKQAQKFHVAKPRTNQQPKLQPIEMYDLKDEDLIESYTQTEDDRKGGNNQNRNRRQGDRRGNNNRYRRGSGRGPGQQVQASAVDESKKPWWKRLLQG